MALKNVPHHGVYYVPVITSSTDAFCKLFDITLQENNYRILFVLNLVLKRDRGCSMCTSIQNFFVLFSCSSSLESIESHLPVLLFSYYILTMHL